VTALYEVELTSAPGPIARVRLRAKPPTGNTATETEAVITRDQIAPRFEAASDDFRFATAAMATAEILRQSPYAKDWTLASVRDIARSSTIQTPERTELVRLIEKAMELSRTGS
jgi:Ca-activated chloride channel family protein